MNAKWFGPRLREIRQSKGLTREEVAERAGCSAGSVRDFEQGIALPTWGTAIAICAALDVKPNVFVQEPADTEKRPRGRPRKE